MKTQNIVLSALAMAAYASAGKIYGAENITRAVGRNIWRKHVEKSTSIAKANRHGGAREHRREIARRLRRGF